MKLVLGSRGSALALKQAHYVASEITKIDNSIEIELKIFKTQGDKFLEGPLSKIGDKGLFVKELETALSNREIDLAVHSVKDLPAMIPDDLCLAAFPPREDPSDALVTRENLHFEELPHGSVVGTSALRRQSLLLHHRADLKINLLRGNVDTRLRKLDMGEYFAIVVAKAGLNRLGIHRGTTLSPSLFIPSPGQGALAIEVRKNDKGVLDLIHPLNDAETAVCVAAERSFLIKMEGGCEVPLGALAMIQADMLVLKGFLGSPDGESAIYEETRGPINKAEFLGEALGALILDQGKKIMKGNP